MSISDLNDIYSWLIGANDKWFDLGLALGIDFGTLSDIEAKRKTNKERLRDMLAHRLQILPLDVDDIVAALKCNTVDDV